MVFFSVLIFLVSMMGMVGLVAAQALPEEEVPVETREAGTEALAESDDRGEDELVDDVAPSDASEGGADDEVSVAEVGAEEIESDAVVTEGGAGLFEQSLSGGVVSDSEPGSSSSGVFDIDGYVRGDTFVGKFPDANQGQLQAGYGELSLQIRGPREPYGSAFADARMRYGQQLDQQQLFLDLREGYVDLYAGLLDLRLGKQIIVWGRADAFNPTNNLMPIDLRIRSPIEDDRRVGNFAARAYLDFSPVRVEGVWIPLYVPTQYPAFVLSDYGDLVSFANPAFPGTGLDEGSLAGRVHLELPEVEASVSYVNGYAPLPGFDLSDFTVGTAANVNLKRTAYRQQVVGADFSTAISDIVAVRGEVAYRSPQDYANHLYSARPDLQYVLGLDRAFGDVTVLVQYMGRYTFDWQKEGSARSPDELKTLQRGNAIVEGQAEIDIRNALAGTNQMLFSQLAAVQHLVTARAEWHLLHETLSLSALGMVNFTTNEWLLFPKLAYHISDRLSTYVGAEIYAGPDGTLFNRISQLTSGYAELRYSF